MEKSSLRAEYLDGLRGIAALAVVAFHANTFFSAFTWTSKYGDFPNLILSRFTNGNFMVCIFFLLSGYVLTFPYAKKERKNTDVSYWGKMVIRRYFRLTPTILASVIILFFLWTTIDIPNQNLTEYGPGFAYAMSEYTFEPDLLKAICYALFRLYTFNGDVYNPVLWSIAIEMIGSIFLFSFFALYPKEKSFTIMASIASAVILLFGFNFGNLEYAVYICLFFAGALINIHFDKIELKNCRLIMLVLGLYLWSLSVYTPEGVWLRLKFSVSSSVIDAVVHSLGAVLLLLSILSDDRAKKALVFRPVLYLGRISFSLYAIHSVVIFTIGLHVFIGFVPICGYKFAAMITYFSVFAISIILAELMTRFVDYPSQRFSKWISEFLE